MKNFFYGKEKGRWLLAVIGVFFVYLLIFRLSVVRFATSDDNTIINSIIYASEQSGFGNKSFMYIHFLLGIPLSFLYRHFQDMPWYDLYSAAILAVSLIVIWRSVLKACYQNNVGFVPAILILSALQIMLFSIPVQQVQFTTTAGVIGTAAIANYLCLEKKREFWLTWVLMLLCFFQRAMVGYVMLAFLLVLIAGDLIYIFLKKKRSGDLKTCLLWFLLLLISIFLLGRMDQTYRKQNQESAEFERYSALRVQYMDYGNRNYEDNSQIFEDAGWDAKLTAMVSCWYFMDERYNAESLEKILSQFDVAEKEAEAYSLEQAGNIWKDLISYHIVKCVLVLTAILILLYSWVQKNILNRRWISNLIIFGIIAGCGLMVLYLCLKGRLPLRVFITIFMPVDLILAVFIVKNWPSAKWKDMNITVKRGVQAAISIIIAMLSLSVLTGLFSLEIQERQQKSRDMLISMKQYVNAQRQNVYIYGDDLIGGEPIFYRTAARTAYNCFFWGGTSMFSDMYYKNLEKNGLKQLHSEDWFRDNIYYLVLDDGRLEVLNNYLDDKYDGVIYEIVDYIGNIKVIKFTRDNN